MTKIFAHSLIPIVLNIVFITKVCNFIFNKLKYITIFIIFILFIENLIISMFANMFMHCLRKNVCYKLLFLIKRFES